MIRKLAHYDKFNIAKKNKASAQGTRPAEENGNDEITVCDGVMDFPFTAIKNHNPKKITLWTGLTTF